MKKSVHYLLLLSMLLLWGCQTGIEQLPVATAPIAATETVPETAVPPTAVSEPAQPTAVSTTIPPTEPPTPLPTPTPQPQLVQSIQFVSVLAEGQLTRPVDLTHAGDERLFVVQQAGIINIIQNGQLLPEPFLDISDRVNSDANEQGLLGLAFHPDSQENGRFYVNYTRSDDSTAIAQFQIDPANHNIADPNSELILLTVAQPYKNHNAGQLKFGPDNYLYIGLGDGGSADDPDNNGQNSSTLLGSMLRLDVNNGNEVVNYAIPASNPFISDPNIPNEIWATGFRNPWRFSFDRLTGDLFIADVGQREWEEVNFQPANSAGGENYGWNILEGTHCFAGDCETPNLTAPVAEYAHSAGGCSVTGGYIYRGTQFPTLWGNYFYTDYCTGNLWTMVQDASGSWESSLITNTERMVASFGEDVNGELYLLDHSSGEILQIQP